MYSVDFLKPNNIRICIRSIFFKPNNICLLSFLESRIIFVFVFGHQNTIRSPLLSRGSLLTSFKGEKRPRTVADCMAPVELPPCRLFIYGAGYILHITSFWGWPLLRGALKLNFWKKLGFCPNQCIDAMMSRPMSTWKNSQMTT